MEFILNNVKWQIIELNTKTLSDRFKGEEDEFLYGFCSYTENIIYINETLVQDRKKNTLIHELTHCWTMSNGWGFDEELSRENLCNIVACSNYFINDIMKKYFENEK